jgi:uncharacterized protein (TIGR02996 family)
MAAVEAQPADTCVFSHAMHGYLALDDTTLVEVNDDCLVGRGARSTLRVFSSRCSREHLQVVRSGDTFWATDLHSVTGTVLASTRQRLTQPTALRDGDRLVLGTDGVVFFLRERALHSQLLVELEGHVAAEPDDDAAWAVYADALNDVGDPLGARLRARPEATHGLSTDLREALTRGSEVTWSHGMLRSARVTSTVALHALLGSRLASLLVGLVISIPRSRQDPDAGLHIAAVAATRLPALKHLTLGHAPAGLAVSLPASPRLTQARVYAGEPP